MSITRFERTVPREWPVNDFGDISSYHRMKFTTRLTPNWTYSTKQIHIWQGSVKLLEFAWTNYLHFIGFRSPFSILFIQSYTKSFLNCDYIPFDFPAQVILMSKISYILRNHFPFSKFNCLPSVEYRITKLKALRNVSNRMSNSSSGLQLSIWYE